MEVVQVIMQFVSWFGLAMFFALVVMRLAQRLPWSNSIDETISRNKIVKSVMYEAVFPVLLILPSFVASAMALHYAAATLPGQPPAYVTPGDNGKECEDFLGDSYTLVGVEGFPPTHTIVITPIMDCFDNPIGYQVIDVDGRHQPGSMDGTSSDFFESDPWPLEQEDTFEIVDV